MENRAWKPTRAGGAGHCATGESGVVSLHPSPIEMRRALDEVRRKLGSPGAFRRAAEGVLKVVRED